MRKAKTHHKLADGKWKLIFGPDDVPADVQRARFKNLGNDWPKGVLAVSFQPSDGPERIWEKSKAEGIAENIRTAEKRADAKFALSKKHEAQAKARDEAEAKAKSDAQAASRAREVAAKEASKKAAQAI